MLEDLAQVPAHVRKGMLEVTSNSPGFALFCERWDAMIENDLDKPIFDPATPPEKTHELKLVRKQLVETKHPRKIIEAMIRSTANEKPTTPHQP